MRAHTAMTARVDCSRTCCAARRSMWLAPKARQLRLIYCSAMEPKSMLSIAGAIRPSRKPAERTTRILSNASSRSNQFERRHSITLCMHHRCHSI